MAIQTANNVANNPSTNPVQEVNEQVRQLQPEPLKKPEPSDENRDNFTPSPEGERISELTSRREELQGQVSTVEHDRNEDETEFARGNEIRSEIDDIDREIRNIERPENETANRTEREALNTYTEQNQTIVRTRNQAQGITNLQGE